MNIGICGGTFDPFHCGHLAPILAVRGIMQWDRVLYIPAYVQPFKTDREAAPAHHRFAMTALATLPYDDFIASPMELERGAISYTVDTLASLRTQYPDATLDWIIGDDNLAQLMEWKSIGRIFELANFAVLTRLSAAQSVPSGLQRSTPQNRPPSGAMVFADNETVPVSSTDVRRRLRAGEPIDDLVPPPVSRYIHHYELYRKAQ